MKWFYAKDGSQKGPVETDELRAKIAAGEVGAGDLVWREGMKDWMPAAQVTELGSYGASPAAGAPTAEQTPPAAQPQAAPASPYQAPQASTPAEYGGAGAPVPNYLWQSIVVTLLCCQPFGIPAIVFAAKVNAYLAGGMQAEAMDASQKAKMWTWIGFGCGLAVWVLYGIYVGVMLSAGASGMNF